MICKINYFTTFAFIMTYPTDNTVLYCLKEAVIDQPPQQQTKTPACSTPRRI